MPDDITPAERTAIAAYDRPVMVCKPGLDSGDAPTGFFGENRAFWSARAISKRKAALKRIEAAEAETATGGSLSPSDAIRIVEGAQ